jgi:hypothetical protein
MKTLHTAIQRLNKEETSKALSLINALEASKMDIRDVQCELALRLLQFYQTG